MQPPSPLRVRVETQSHESFRGHLLYGRPVDWSAHLHQKQTNQSHGSHGKEGESGGLEAGAFNSSRRQAALVSIRSIPSRPGGLWYNLLTGLRSKALRRSAASWQVRASIDRQRCRGTGPKADNESPTSNAETWDQLYVLRCRGPDASSQFSTAVHYTFRLQTRLTCRTDKSNILRTPP